MANRLRLILHQINIKGAYLNGVLREDDILYMHHPPSYKTFNMGMCVLRLQKALYGLKQAGRCWYQTFSSILSSLGFIQCSMDQAIYHKTGAAAGDLIVIAVHVNNCTIAASQPCLVEDFKTGLSKHVEVTNLGELHWMLGIEVKRDHAAGTIHLSQCAYIDSILNHFNFANHKLLSTPMDVQVKLSCYEWTPISSFTSLQVLICHVILTFPCDLM